jgi:hypothetical protein
MIITIPTVEYDVGRWSRPWIAVVTAWPPSAANRPELRWGGWVGHPGAEGLLTIDAVEWDIVRTGQRYYRDPSASDNDWWIVRADGSLTDTSRTDAYRLWVARLERARSAAPAPAAVLPSRSRRSTGRPAVPRPAT